MKQIDRDIKLDNMRTKKQGIEAKGVKMFMGNVSDTFSFSLLRPGVKILSVLWYNLGAAKLKTVERILKTYFLIFKVKPFIDSPHAQTFEGALAHFWVVAPSSEFAVLAAEHYLEKNRWQIQEMEQKAVETKEKHFLGKEIGLEYFRHAQKSGLSVYLSGWTVKGVSVDLN